MREETLRDVPLDRVGEVTASFCRDGAEEVDCRKVGDTWTVTARFPSN